MSGSNPGRPASGRLPDDVVIGLAFQAARRVLLAMCGAAVVLVALAAAAVAMASSQQGAAGAALLVLGSAALVALVTAAFAFRALLGTTNRASAIAQSVSLRGALKVLARAAIVVDVVTVIACVLFIRPTVNATVAGLLCLVIAIQLPVLIGGLRRWMPNIDATR